MLKTTNDIILVNIQIVRAFTKLRQMVLSHADLKKKIEMMERKYDRQFKNVFDALDLLFEDFLTIDETQPKRKIGFVDTSDKNLTPGELLFAARSGKKMTQKELSKKTKIDQRRISEMERGKTPIGKKDARALAKALKIKYQLLLDE